MIRSALLVGTMLVVMLSVSCGGASSPSTSPSPGVTTRVTSTASPTVSPTPTTAPTPVPTEAPTPVPTAEPTAEPTAVPTQPPAPAALHAHDFYFEYNGERAPAISVQAGQTVTLQIQNEGASIHDVQVANSDGTFGSVFCKPGDGTSFACSDPGMIRAGTTATLTVAFPAPGTYRFHCDFHPSQMDGTFVVQ